MSPPANAAVERQSSMYDQPVVASASDSPVVETSPCEVCGCRSAQPIFELPGLPYRVVRCLECDLGSLFPMPDVSEIADFYPPQYYGGQGRKFAGLVERLVRLVGARQARFLMRTIPAGGRVLDVGCGRGVTLRALADAGFEAHGFEVSTEAITGLDPRIQPHIAESLSAANLPGGSFDAVILWHVLEHVPAPRETLLEIRRLLRPGGVLIVAVPNASSWQARWTGPAWFHLDLPRHLYHFPLPALRRLLNETGFACRRSHHFSLRQNPFGWIQSVLNLIPGLPRNGLYELLHHRPQDGPTIPRLDWRMSLLLKLAFVALAAPALAMSILAAACRQGATVHVVAVRR